MARHGVHSAILILLDAQKLLQLVSQRTRIAEDLPNPRLPQRLAGLEVVVDGQLAGWADALDVVWQVRNIRSGFRQLGCCSRWKLNGWRCRCAVLLGKLRLRGGRSVVGLAQKFRLCFASISGLDSFRWRCRRYCESWNCRSLSFWSIGRSIGIVVC